MGMDIRIRFDGTLPSWPEIQQKMTQAGVPVTLRMIDGLPAFPNEVPTEPWNELRVSTPSGMITLRPEGIQLILLVWGNADPELLRHWKILAWACAAAGNGEIKTADGFRSPTDYLREERLFEA